MKILVPMAGHEAGLHKGHRALISYAKNLGDVTVAITPDWLKLQGYMLEGRQYEVTQDVSLQVSQIEEMDVAWEIRRPNILNESRRRELKMKAESVVAAYDEHILLENYRQFLIAATMNRILKRPNCDVVVRGPEVPSFILRAFKGHFGWIDMKIYDRIVKDQNGLKSQTNFKQEKIKGLDLTRLKKIVDDLGPALKKGDNPELTAEATSLLADPDWQVRRAVLFDNPIFQGKIQVFRFSVKGIFLEDNTYIPG